MDERTRAYLRGRFRDYYRRVEPERPPAAASREWAYIPWSDAGSTTMVRHNALLDLGDLGGFLRRDRPRHVYFSAGRYREPGASTMGAKDWQGSDLVFDLDADHLPGVRPERDTYREMLAACKAELMDLLGFLEGDFGFEELEIVFSGGRGYHVHVRDDAVRDLDRSARREVVDYVRGIDVSVDRLVRTETVTGDHGRKTPAERKTLITDGGWGRRVHRRLLTVIEDLADRPEEAARERLLEYDGIGEERARMVLAAIGDSRDAIEAGVIDVNDGLRQLATRVAEEVLETAGAAIDEPVTTDIHRLIRLPGSLHGGTGLRVTPIRRADLADFEPLRDAVPDPFRDHEVTVRTEGGPPVELGGETFSVPDGVTTLPEYAAVFLMARGRAVKEKEV